MGASAPLNLLVGRLGLEVLRLLLCILKRLLDMFALHNLNAQSLPRRIESVDTGIPNRGPCGSKAAGTVPPWATLWI
jgi:hypothetical protein